MSTPAVIGKFEEPYVIGGHVRRHCKILAGPVLYTVGGDTILGRDLGDKWIVHIYPAVSTDGTHIAYFIPSSSSKKSVSAKMFIFVTATGAQAAAVDLSAKRFMVQADMVG